jgi:hypothetical protein
LDCSIRQGLYMASDCQKSSRVSGHMGTLRAIPSARHQQRLKRQGARVRGSEQEMLCTVARGCGHGAAEAVVAAAKSTQQAARLLMQQVLQRGALLCIAAVAAAATACSCPLVRAQRKCESPW